MARYNNICIVQNFSHQSFFGAFQFGMGARVLAKHYGYPIELNLLEWWVRVQAFVDITEI